MDTPAVPRGFWGRPVPPEGQGWFELLCAHCEFRKTFVNPTPDRVAWQANRHRCSAWENGWHPPMTPDEIARELEEQS